MKYGKLKLGKKFPLSPIDTLIGIQWDPIVLMGFNWVQWDPLWIPLDPIEFVPNFTPIPLNPIEMFNGIPLNPIDFFQW